MRSSGFRLFPLFPLHRPFLLLCFSSGNECCDWLPFPEVNVEQMTELVTERPHFNMWQRSDCVIAMTASNINFHSWAIKLQINQANRAVFAISGPGCSVSSTCRRLMIAAFPESPAAVWKQFPRTLKAGLNGASAEFSGDVKIDFAGPGGLCLSLSLSFPP